MKKLAALAMLLALTLTACGEEDSDKDSSKKDDKETTSQNETTQSGGDDEAGETGSDDRPSVDEIVALFEQGEQASGMEMPDTLKKCMAEGLYDSELTDEQVNDYLAAKLDKETTDVMATVTSECAGV